MPEVKTGPAGTQYLPPEAPLYKLLQPLYADDVLIEAETRGPRGLEATVIEYDGEPNEAMEPMNEAAKARMTKFFAKLAAGNKAAGRVGDRTPPIGDLVEAAVAARPREMPVRHDNIPPTAGTLYENNPFKTAPEKPAAVKLVTPDTPIAVLPRKVMGTIVKEESILTGAP